MHAYSQHIPRLYVSEVGVPHVLLLCDIIPRMYELHVTSVSLPVALSVLPLQLFAVRPAAEVPSLCFL